MTRETRTPLRAEARHLGPLRALLAAGALAAGPAGAEAPVLDLPLDCALGHTCYIEDYVDAQPGEGQRDYTCGLKSRDAHSGTDFALLSHAQMHDGVPVLAAATGIVRAVRNDMPDRPVTAANRTAIEGRECGNAVAIRHGDGWETLYCHMRQGSVRVRPGQTVDAGTPLGLVGISGLTNYPHLHLSVLRHGTRVDPFAPEASETCGTATGNGLWRDAPDYIPGGLFTAGFSLAVPGFDAVKSGAARVAQAPTDAPALVLYGHAFYPADGDVMEMVVDGPTGPVLRRDLVLENPQKQLFRAFGRKKPAAGWPAGLYRGRITLRRDGRVIAVRHADITLR